VGIGLKWKEKKSVNLNLQWFRGLAVVHLNNNSRFDIVVSNLSVVGHLPPVVEQTHDRWILALLDSVGLAEQFLDIVHGLVGSDL
jgi:hypothetical protein